MYKIKTDKILGSRRFSNYWWATTICIGGIAFFIVGLSSYLKMDILPSSKPIDLLFIPQGMIMMFYGTIAIITSIFLWLTIIWNVGAGYNEFNHDKGLITIFRFGFPGKNRMLKFQYRINNIQSIHVKIHEGITPHREIYLKLKDKREIPLTHIGQPLLLSEIEEQATSLAKFLGVVLEGLE